MKIRNGFVSNSSSSSFIIIAPKNYKWYENEKFIREFGKNAKEIKDIYQNAFIPRQNKCLGADVDIYRGQSDCCEPCWNITDQSEFEEFCEKMGYETYEFANELYDKFANFFETPECLIAWSED